MCIRDRPEILPERLRVRVHIAGLKIYESVADIVTALKQVGQLVEIDRQRTEHSLFGVINRHIERLRTRLRDRRPVHSDRHDPIERGSRSPQLTAGDTLRSPGPYASDWARFAGAFRRAELAGLDTADVRAHPTDGLHVMVRAAKNDPGRAGQVKAVPYGTEVATCGPCAWARWRGVVAAADAGGRVAVLRTVHADDPASHVCRSPAVDAAVDGDGDPAEPAFRKLDKTARAR